MDIERLPARFAPARALFLVECGTCREEGALEAHLHIEPCPMGHVDVAFREGDCWVCPGCGTPHLVHFALDRGRRCIGVRVASLADIAHLPPRERAKLEQLQRKTSA